MKRLLLVALLCISALQGFSNGMMGLLAGAGLTGRNNYDVGLSYGLMGYRAISYRVGLGAMIFSQQYDLYYTNELNNPMGSSLRTNLSYGFFSPLLIYDMRNHDGRYKFYLTAGVGYNLSGYDSVHKWNMSSYPGASYDSLIDGSKNINKLTYRIGFGFLQFVPMNRHFTFCFNEDIGFLPSVLSSTTDKTDATLRSNVARYYRPTYISLRLGIFFR